jgi:acetoin utilization protein AcuB
MPTRRANHAKIADVMTRVPVTIGAQQPLTEARALMDRYQIRHLPVMDLGRMVGVVSARELDLLALDAEQLPVSMAMATEVLTAEPDETVASVVAKMAERKAGSAVVVRHGDVVGVFTTIDALRVLEDYAKRAS